MLSQAVVIALLLLAGPLSPAAGVVVVGTHLSGHPAISIVPSAEFPFPATYGSPQVPRTVGAQGVSGPTSPAGSIGLTVPYGAVGVQGHIGPPGFVSTGFYAPSIDVDLLVLNGTISSSSVVSHNPVYLQNVTLGINLSENSSSYGYANFSVTPGWYIVYVPAPSNLTLPFEQMEDFSKAMSKVIYLMSAADSSVNVANGNGSTSWATVWVHENLGGNAGPGSTSLTRIPQLAVSLWNQSAVSPDTIATGATLGNGSLVFLRVNPSYTYYLLLDGYEQNLTGTRYYVENSTTPTPGHAATFAPGLNTVTLNPSGGTSRIIGGSITGTAFAPYAWTLAANTTVSDARIVLSNRISLDGHKLSFVNDTIAYNTSQILPSGSISFVNTTLVMVGYSRFLPHGNNATADYSYLVGDFPKGSPSVYFSAAVFVLPQFVNNSVIWNWPLDTGPGVNGPGYSIYSNDLIANLTYDSRVSEIFLAQELIHDTILPLTTTVALNLNETNISFTDINAPTLSNSWAPPYQRGPFSALVLYNDILGPNESAVTNVTLANTESATFLHNVFEFDGLFRLPVYEVPLNSRVAVYRFPNNLTSSYCVYNETSVTALQPNLDFGSNTHIANNDFLAPTGPSYYDLISHDTKQTRTNDQSDASVMNVFFGGASYVGHNIFSGASGGGTVSNVVISNNDFSNISGTNTVLTLGAGNGVPILNVTVENNTFSGEYFNWTGQLATGLPGFEGGVTLVYQSVPGNSTVIEYNTIYSRILGGGVGGPAAGFSGDLRDVRDNAFYNNQSSGPTPYWTEQANGLPANIRISADLIAVPGPAWAPTTISGNWLLSVNNLTAPLEVYPPSGATSYPSVPPYGTIGCANNRIYISPWPGEASVPLYEADHGSLSYGAPVTAGAQISFSGGTYVVNTSGVWDPSPRLFLYNATPDFNATTGLLSYENGLAGGAQPTFEWRGFQYTESVEPSIVEVGANSTDAPPLFVQLSGLSASASYTVERFAPSGQLSGSSVYNSSSTGSINLTYSPGTMGESVVFVPIPASTGGRGSGILGLPGDTVYAALLGTAVVAALVGFVVWARFGRRARPGRDERST